MDRAGLNGLQLAAAAGVDKNSVVRWRKGRTLPRHENLRVLAHTLKATVEELAGPDLPAKLPQQQPAICDPGAGEPSAPDGLGNAEPSTGDLEDLLRRLVAIADTAEATLAPDLMAVLAEARALAVRHPDEAC